ncbi:hypothetical protein [Nevskia sp.]|uniref:hypothetical protein n=1 Tax=Nevskia sp. TaxID=1929292 RepID=UPI0025D0853B|nr:hypothetical protein [Nevskia sp.]
MEERFFEALNRTGPKLPAQFQTAFAEILTPEVAATVVGTLALIAAAHLIGGVFAAAIDILLIGAGFVFLGWTAFEAGQQLGKFIYLTVTATESSSLDYAAEALSKVVVLIGVEAFLILLTKAAVKSAKRSNGPSEQTSSHTTNRSRAKESSTTKPPSPAVSVAPKAYDSSTRITAPSTGKIVDAEKGKTTTVLGSFSSDMEKIIKEQLKVPKSIDFGGRPGTFNVLNVPDALYRNPEQFWAEYNKPFLDFAIRRGDTIQIVTKPTLDTLYRADGSMTGFGRELEYLAKNGYRYDAITSTMIPFP